MNKQCVEVMELLADPMFSDVKTPYEDAVRKLEQLGVTVN